MSTTKVDISPIPSKPITSYPIGSLWQDRGNVYRLHLHGDQYTAFGIDARTRWRTPEHIPKKAVEGLEPWYGTITLRADP